jgi:hypothetical protein
MINYLKACDAEQANRELRDRCDALAHEFAA